ncbi:putative Cytokinin dehydrogenase 6 [Cocos nucifera]|uniref:Putative Cytokinin dehydrogenase 6 n=1 Tax=Cocos nucifera TaxID=13894 RepID=A0A8K0MW84_COCNU|nr:putative Cytokinin dehydrogenase 6 [Cocos nucifera]
MVTCSGDHNSELFYAVLGGLGQFGIITRARISLEPAPQRVRWVRLIYADFGAFTRDQERLIMMSEGAGFDYVEGSVPVADGSLIGSWKSSSFSGRDSERIAGLGAQHGLVYCLEGAMYYNLVTASSSSVVDQELELLLEELSFVPRFAFTNDVSYERFLHRVHDGELKLRSVGLWDAPHPWLTIFVPKSSIQDFNNGVFMGILEHNKSMGPILIYAMKKNKWDGSMSSVVPDEDVFYSIGLLWSAAMDNWEYLENQNMEILRFCDQKGIKYKQYLPHYRSQEDWMKHFGPKWNMFVEMKRKWDGSMSSVVPDEDVFYSIGLLWSAAMDNWEYLENQNMEILRFCDQKGIKYKQYLPHYRSQEDWMKHFGPKWNMFVEMKRKYDPKALLSPGQSIFTSSLVDHA